MSEAQKTELANLYHLSKAAGATTRYEQKLWASKHFAIKYPAISSTKAYKELCNQEAWRY